MNQTIPVGTLVRSKKVETVLLTPKNGHDDISTWIEWKPKDIAITLSTPDKNGIIFLLTIEGIGSCFLDEVLRIR